MKHLYCDICKKEVKDPYPSRTFFHIREYDLCETCRDDLELAVKQTIRTKKPFDFAWFEKLRIDLIQDGIRKDKISLPKTTR